MKQKIGDEIPFRWGGQELFRWGLKDMVTCHEERDVDDGHWTWTYALQLLQAIDNHSIEDQVRLAYWVKTPKNPNWDKFGQFAATLREETFLQLITQAIAQGFFTDDFVRELKGRLGTYKL